MTNGASRGFDRLAPVYRLLTQVTFGDALTKAQCHFIHHLKPDDRILILGGGDGSFLKTLLASHPKLQIDYIDISPRMIALAKQKKPSGSHVNFIVGTENNIPNTDYSVVITNFYLDLFTDKTLKRIIEKINHHLQPHARWFVTDFVNEKWWHGFMLWIMYRFFRITTGIEAKRLPDWQVLLEESKMLKVESTSFYSGFIKSVVIRTK